MNIVDGAGSRYFGLVVLRVFSCWFVSGLFVVVNVVGALYPSGDVDVGYFVRYDFLI